MREQDMARTEKEKMLAGELYVAVDPELVTARARARKLLRAYNQSTEDELKQREEWLAQLLGSAGPGVWIEPPFFCDYGEHIRLGARVYMNFQCVILDCNPVTLGDDVFLGPGVHIYAATHPLDPDERIKGPELGRPVTMAPRCGLAVGPSSARASPSGRAAPLVPGVWWCGTFPRMSSPRATPAVSSGPCAERLV